MASIKIAVFAIFKAVWRVLGVVWYSYRAWALKRS